MLYDLLCCMNLTVRISASFCMTLPFMHLHDLTWGCIHSEERLVFSYLDRLGVGIDCPPVCQGMLDNERDRIRRYILEKVCLLCDCNAAALHYTVPKSFFDMACYVRCPDIADGMVIL